MKTLSRTPALVIQVTRAGSGFEATFADCVSVLQWADGTVRRAFGADPSAEARGAVLLDKQLTGLGSDVLTALQDAMHQRTCWRSPDWTGHRRPRMVDIPTLEQLATAPRAVISVNVTEITGLDPSATGTDDCYDQVRRALRAHRDTASGALDTPRTQLFEARARASREFLEAEAERFQHAGRTLRMPECGTLLATGAEDRAAIRNLGVLITERIGLGNPGFGQISREMGDPGVSLRRSHRLPAIVEALA